MAYNQDLEKRLDFALKVFPKSILEYLSKKKMFGGLAIMYKGKMTVGIVKNDLMVRVLGSKMDAILHMDAVRPMDSYTFLQKVLKPRSNSNIGLN